MCVKASGVKVVENEDKEKVKNRRKNEYNNLPKSSISAKAACNIKIIKYKN